MKAKTVDATSSEGGELNSILHRLDSDIAYQIRQDKGYKEGINAAFAEAKSSLLAWRDKAVAEARDKAVAEARIDEVERFRDDWGNSKRKDLPDYMAWEDYADLRLKELAHPSPDKQN
jgi:hypothetical protein